MSNYLEIVDRIIQAHHSIKEDIRSAHTFVGDFEALFSVRRSYADWTQSSMDALAEKQKKIKEMVLALEEGLTKHFNYEETNLPPILGDVLLRGLLLDHEKIKTDLNAVKYAVSISLEGMSREEILAYRGRFQQLIDGISNTIEQHANREEVILGMAKSALESEKNGQ